MSGTNWKYLGRKQGANMKNYRNVKSDKSFYNNGKWDTIYTDDDIKRLAYYNVELPHVVGIGTKIPFSKLSFGDSTDSGHHIKDTITAGKVTAIAMHEKSISKTLEGNATSKNVEGQDFTGFSYVNKLRSVRKVLTNEEASGIAFFSNKSNVAEDTSLKTDKAIMYVTDDNFVSIGGVPKEYELIDVQNPIILPGNISTEDGKMLTGPNIMLDISGSMHVNGFINFLRNGIEAQPDQKADNPAGQLTYNTTTKNIEYAPDKTSNTGRACPEGAIWVGFDKKDDTLAPLPRLFIQRAGVNSRVLTEFDTDIFSTVNGSDATGLTWNGSTDEDNGGENAFYIFRNPNTAPNNTLINTYIGRSGVTDSAQAFDGDETSNPLPRFQGGIDTDPNPSALSVVGNLSVFDFTTGGTNGTYLTGNENGNLLNDYKRILTSDIYTKEDPNDSSKPGQGELGSIYMDRHLMIGGFKGNLNEINVAPKFEKYSSAIDISGGIANKPIMRVLTGSNNGSLAEAGRNCQDSIIIGNTAQASITGDNKKSFIFGDHSAIQEVNNTIVHGTNNSVNNLTNSLVVGNNLIAGNETTGADVIDGLVALGVGDANLKVNGDERIVFATNNGTSSMKALTIDKDGNVTIIGNLNVQGDEIILDVEHKVVQDGSIKLAGKDGEDVNGNHQTKSSGSLNSAGATTNPPATEEHEAGLKIFIHKENNTTHFVQWTFDEDGNQYNTNDPDVDNHTHNPTTANSGDRWTTAMSSRSIGIAAAANTPGSVDTERFKVLNNGDLQISSNGTDNKFTVQASSGDLNINNKFKVTGQDGHVDMSGNLKVFGNVTAGTDGNVTIAPNGTGDVNLEADTVKIGDTDTDATITTNGTGDLTLSTNNGTDSGSIKIEDGNNNNITIAPNGSGVMAIYEAYDDSTNPTKGAEFVKNNNKVDLKISGKLTVDGLIDPTGLILDSATAPNNADVTNKLGLYFDGSSGVLKTKTFDGTDTTETTLATTADISEITSGSGSTNVNSANKVRVSSKSNDQTYKVLFAGAATGNNQEIFGDDTSFNFNPNSNTLTTTTFSGALTGTATKASNLSFASGATSGFVKWDSTTDQISTDTSTYLTSVPQEDVEDIVGGMLEGTQSGITVSYSGNGTSAGNLNFDVNKSITLDNDADKVIKIADQTTTGAGRNLTIQAGKGKSQIGGNLTLKAGNADGATNIGGNLILQAGDGDSDDEDGEIRLVGISRSDGDNILSIDTLGNISGAPKIIGFQDADATISFEGERDDGDGRKLTIKAGSVGDGTHNGGDLELKGGDGNGIGSSAGNVNISGNNLSASSTSSGSNLTIDSGTGWSKLKLNATSTDATDHHNYISSVNQKLKFLAGPADDDCVLTIEKTPKGAITLGEGADNMTPIIKTARNNQNLVLEPHGSGKVVLKKNVELGGDTAFTISRPDQTTTNTEGTNTTINAQKGKGTGNGGDLTLAAGAAGGSGSSTQGNVNITGNKIELNGTVTSAANTNLALTGSDAKPQIIINGPLVSKINKVVTMWENNEVVDMTANNLINGFFISLKKNGESNTNLTNNCAYRLPAPWQVCDLFENVGAEGIMFEFYIEHMLDWDLKVRTHSNTNAITADPPRDGETKQGWWQYIGRYGTNNTSGPSIYQNGMAPPSGPFTQAQIIGNETVTWQINTFDSNGGWTGTTSAGSATTEARLDTYYSGPRGYFKIKGSSYGGDDLASGFFQKFICRIDRAGYSSNNTKDKASIVIYAPNNVAAGGNGIGEVGNE